MLKSNNHVIMSNCLFGHFVRQGFHKSQEVIDGFNPWYVWIANKKWLLHDNLARHILFYQKVCYIPAKTCFGSISLCKKHLGLGISLSVCVQDKVGLWSMAKVQYPKVDG